MHTRTQVEKGICHRCGSIFKTAPAMSRLQPLQAAVCRLPEVLTLGFLVVVADFAVIGEIQTLDLLFGAGSQTDSRLDDQGQNDRSYDCKHHGQYDRLELFDPQGMPYDVLEIRAEV